MIYLTSNSLSVSELMPAAKTKPSGSKAATGLPITLIYPWQFGDLKSHNLRLLSNDPDTNMSSIGDTHNDTTFLVCPVK